MPFQLIYTGKTSRSLPHVEFSEGFLLSYNEKHWSNETETFSLVNDVINPYITKTKKELGPPDTQKALLVCDAFTAQSADKVMHVLTRLNIKVVPVPRNITHLLQPLDLTTNVSLKKMEKRGFSDYFTFTVTKVLEKELNRDVATIEVDLKLSTLTPIHAMVLMDIYDFLLNEKGKKVVLNGWKAAGITKALEDSRMQGNVSSLDPLEQC